VPRSLTHFIFVINVQNSFHVDRVEMRLKAVQQDNSRLRDTAEASEATIRSLKHELEATTATLKQQKDVSVSSIRSLGEAEETLRTEVEDLRTSLTQAETLAAQTQKELISVNSALTEERTSVERLTARLDDETAKSQRLEKTVVDLYSELESFTKDVQLEAEANTTTRQELEAKLHVAEEENTRLNDLLKTAEKRVEELEQRLKEAEGVTGSEEVTDRAWVTPGESCEAGPSTDAGGGLCRPVAAVLGVSVSTEADVRPSVLNVSSVSTEAAVPPSDDDKLGERYYYYFFLRPRSHLAVLKSRSSTT